MADIDAVFPLPPYEVLDALAQARQSPAVNNALFWYLRDLAWAGKVDAAKIKEYVAKAEGTFADERGGEGDG